MTPMWYSKEAYNKYKATSNFNCTRVHFPFSACGWMDMHTDEVAYRKDELYRITIMKIHPNAVIVHTVDNQYVIVEAKPGDTIVLDNKLPHGLLPRKIAETIVANNRINSLNYRRWVKRIRHRAFKAKCIWVWVQDECE
jgi:signal peptidase I